MRVLAARATELERDFPFALARQLFEPALAALDEPAREALFEGAAGAARGALGMSAAERAARRRVRRPARPLLADRSARRAAAAAAGGRRRALVRRGLARLPRLPRAAAGGAARSARGRLPAGRGRAPSSLARIATDSQARRLTPRALSAGGAAALLADELEREPEEAFTATCHEVSGGNPFLLRELARTLAAEEILPAAVQAPRVRQLAPERVTRTVQLRLARLSPVAQAVARAVVVLGDDADGQLAAELVGLDAAAVARGADELRAAAILDPDATLRFIHPLVRTALDAELPAGERAAAHARAAELLRARGASAQRLATHLIATDARGERATVETLLEAGRAALASGAAALGDRLPDARPARAGAGRPARRDPRPPRHGRHPRARPGAVRGAPARGDGGAGAR